MRDEPSGLHALIRPGRGACIAGEFFAASAHVPMAIALGLLLARPAGSWPLVLPLMLGALLQAWLIGSRGHAERPVNPALQLVGAGSFAGAMAAADWSGWLGDPLVRLYAGASLLLAGLAWVDRPGRGIAGEAACIAQHVVRALAVAGVYAVVASGHPGHFLAEPEHRYLTAGIALLGVALGVSAVVARRDRARLEALAEKLGAWSEMLLGKSRLHRAVGREDDLRPRRTRRSVLFADIRGFTKWSETRPPEEVLLMLDGVYAAAEHAAAPFTPVRTKYTGDEVMMFFSEPLAAASAALALRDEVGAFLAIYGLHVGVGLHHGEVIEGLVGGAKTKAYDILGDTVNTAKRVSDHAGPGRIVVTFTFYEATRGRIEIAGDQRINAKGKTSVVLVAELVGVRATPAGGGDGALPGQS